MILTWIIDVKTLFNTCSNDTYRYLWKDYIFTEPCVQPIYKLPTVKQSVSFCSLCMTLGNQRQKQNIIAVWAKILATNDSNSTKLTVNVSGHVIGYLNLAFAINEGKSALNWAKMTIVKFRIAGLNNLWVWRLREFFIYRLVLGVKVWKADA